MGFREHVCEGCGTTFRYVPNGRAVHFHNHACYAASLCNKPEDAWKHVDQSGGPDACWEWKFTRTDQGYGSFWVAGEHWVAHRLIWTLTKGPIPAGQLIRHLLCDNPPCCNPAHLTPGTEAQNSGDMVAHGRAAAGDRNAMRRYPDRVPRGESNGNSTLTEDAVRDIRQAFDSRSEKLVSIARRHGISVATVYRIGKREGWLHVA